MNQEVQTLLSKLTGKKKSGRQWIARCPAHEDSSPSLSIGEGEDGQVLVTCHAGCSLEDIVSSVGLTVNDLFPETSPEVRERKKDELVAQYDYFDADGELVMQVCRYLTPDGGKTFRQRRPNSSGGWNWDTAGVEKPLYRLPQVLRAASASGHIYVAEGEKDVHTLEGLGLVATTNPGGAGKWQDNWTQAFMGAGLVTIIIDNDEPGRKHGETIANELNSIGIEFELLKPPGKYKDISQFIGSGGTLDRLTDLDFVAEERVDAFLTVADLVDDLRLSNRSDEQKIERLKFAIERAEVRAEPLRIQVWERLLNQEIPPPDWIVPDFLERGDRAILVAPEGVGKSMLARQIALCTTYGINWLNNKEIPGGGKNTLYIDLENPRNLVLKKSKYIHDNLVKMIQNTGIPPSKGVGSVILEPQGINILTQRDRARLEAAIDEARPDLVLLGPLYKSFIDPGGQTSEAVIGQVVRFFDYLRTEYKFALWLEHHPPMGESWTSRPMRPFGSSVWGRWPEFGLSMKPDLDNPGGYLMEMFRGARDERDIPLHMRRGGDMGLPFVVVDYMKQ